MGQNSNYEIGPYSSQPSSSSFVSSFVFPFRHTPITLILKPKRLFCTSGILTIKDENCLPVYLTPCLDSPRLFPVIFSSLGIANPCCCFHSGDSISVFLGGVCSYLRFERLSSDRILAEELTSVFPERATMAGLWVRNLRLRLEPGFPMMTQSQSTSPLSLLVSSIELMVPEPVSAVTRTSQS